VACVTNTDLNRLQRIPMRFLHTTAASDFPVIHVIQSNLTLDSTCRQEAVDLPQSAT